MKSNLSNNVYEILTKVFPSHPIIEEYYVKFKNTKLFFDYYIKDLGVLIEVQGQQHTEFVRHFHNDRYAFLKQKDRDNLKIEYVDENRPKLCLVRFNYDEEVTEILLLNKVYKAMKGGFCE